MNVDKTDILQIKHDTDKRLLPVLQKAAELTARQDKICVIAIDGRAASGKTTMALHLQEVLGGEVIHMDDFFLPLSLRTEERFQVPGGNVHYERFQEEVLPYIGKPESFSYRKFDCSRMDYHGVKEVGVVRYRIVEGSYSCHPLFGSYADITVFADVDPEEQLRRIQIRNGMEKALIFQSRWIPMEEQYFTTYNISEKADLKI